MYDSESVPNVKFVARCSGQGSRVTDHEVVSRMDPCSFDVAQDRLHRNDRERDCCGPRGLAMTRIVALIDKYCFRYYHEFKKVSHRAKNGGLGLAPPRTNARLCSVG